MMVFDRAMARWRLRACDSVGDQARVVGAPTIYARPGRIRIGHQFHLSSRPAPSHIAIGPDGVLDIGDHVSIAHGAAISAYESITIGDGTCIGPFVVMMDTNFHGSSGGREIQHETRPILIGRDCRIGSRVTITRGASIGDGTEILAGSVVSSRIPDGVCAGGARARVLGPAGETSASCWILALLPGLIQTVLETNAELEVEALPSYIAALDDRNRSRLIAAITQHFDVDVDPTRFARAASLSELEASLTRSRAVPRRGRL